MDWFSGCVRRWDYCAAGVSAADAFTTGVFSAAWSFEPKEEQADNAMAAKTASKADLFII